VETVETTEDNRKPLERVETTGDCGDHHTSVLFYLSMFENVTPAAITRYLCTVTLYY